MPLLGALISTLMVGLVDFFVRFFTRKVAVLFAALTAFSAMTAVLLVSFNSVVSPLADQLFSNEVGQFLGLAFPPVAGTCMATIASTWAACALYGWQTRALALSVQA
jgi:hypothetical protein